MNTAFWTAFKDENCSSWNKPFKPELNVQKGTGVQIRTPQQEPRRWNNVGLMLVHRPWFWASIKFTLVQHNVFWGSRRSNENIKPITQQQQLGQQRNTVGLTSIKMSQHWAGFWSTIWRYAFQPLNTPSIVFAGSANKLMLLYKPHSSDCMVKMTHPYQQTLIQCWINAGPTSQTMGQRWLALGQRIVFAGICSPIVPLP